MGLPINGKIEAMYKNTQLTEATFPVTLDEAVYTSEGKTLPEAYQEKLYSGVNIKTINSNSVLGAGNIELEPKDLTILRKADVVDNLTSITTDLPLSAKQGKELKDLIDGLPNAMVFKGSLGTAGTITDLPTATTALIGNMYQVITAGTYAGKAAKVGDLFVCNDAPEWILLPTTTASGTVLNVATGFGLTGGPITTVGAISLDKSGVSAGTYTKVTVDEYGRVTFGELQAATDIPVLDTSKITTGTFSDAFIASAANWNQKVDSNASITADTRTKITYDSKGLVTAGADLEEDDIPALHLTKITDVVTTADEVNLIHDTTITGHEDLDVLSGTGATITPSNVLCLENLTDNVQEAIDELRNYVEIDVPITGWSDFTWGGEACKVIDLDLTGGVAGKHPVVSCVPSKASTLDAENEAFGLLLAVKEDADILTLYSKEVPAVGYKLQVKFY